MNREWKTGDVALLGMGIGGSRPTVAIRTSGGCWDDGEQLIEDDFPHWVRPLLVIDSNDRGQIERLLDEFRSLSGWSSSLKRESANALQAAIRARLNPKPAEPTGRGAVVEATCRCDRDARKLFVRDETAWSAECPWNARCGSHSWDTLDAVEVLSTGAES